MVKAIERHFQGAVWQRCQVHFRAPTRWRFAGVSSVAGVAADEVVTDRRRAGGQGSARAAIAELQKKAPKVARLLEESGEEIFGVMLCRRRIGSGCADQYAGAAESGVETEAEVIRVFAHEQSCLRLIAAAADGDQPDWMGGSTEHGGGTRGRYRAPGAGRLRSRLAPGYALRKPAPQPTEQKPTTLRNGNLQNI